MIICITSFAYDDGILPHFLKYYRSIGVEKFVIAVDDFLGKTGDTIRQVVTNQPDVFIVPASERFRLTKIPGQIDDETRKLVASPQDWIIASDLDEFNEYPQPLTDLIKEMEKGGFTHCDGNMLDRVALDQTLAPLKKDLSIWEQYPLGAPLTNKLTQAITFKVVLSRGDVGLSNGHHWAIGTQLKSFSQRGVVHHFKWRAGLIEMMEKRYAVELKNQVKWSEESKLLLNYFKSNNKLDVNSNSIAWKPS